MPELVLGLVLVIVILVVASIISLAPAKSTRHELYMDVERAKESARDRMKMHESFLCPWCRQHKIFPYSYKAESDWAPSSIFCQDCQKEIKSRIRSNSHPRFISDEEYKKLQNDFRFWVGLKEYELKEINRKEVCS